VPAAQPRRELLHVGILGPHHPRRRELVTALQSRGRLPLRHATTSRPEEAAALYAQHALVLNVPLNHDLNHRFFEVMAAGVPLVLFGGPMCFGPAASSSPKHWCCSSWPSPIACGLYDLHQGSVGAVGDGANRNHGASHPFGFHQLAVPRGQFHSLSAGLGPLFWAALGERPEIGATRHQMWCGAVDRRESEAIRCTTLG